MQLQNHKEDELVDGFITNLGCSRPRSHVSGADSGGSLPVGQWAEGEGNGR